jgi:uncharacterized Zn-finger protein
MAHASTPKFHNDMGLEKIKIGAKKFQCIGAKPPFDHPHVFLDMGEDAEIVCPYCSTLYVYETSLAHDDALPKNAAYSEDSEAA